MQSSPTQLKLKITEDQRLEATFMSGTKSGDGIPATFMNDFAAFLDVGLNPVSPGSNITLVEVPDTVPPFLVLVTLDLSHGIIYLTGSETIKTVGNAKLRAPGYLIGYDPDDSNIKLNLTTAAILNRSDHSSDLEKVSLEGASFMAELSLVVTVQLTEAQRAAAIRFSGTNGGDGNSTFLQLPKGALKDLEELESNATDAFIITEIPDTILPNATSAVISYGTGTITLIVSETVDATPQSKVDPSKIFVSDFANNFTISLSGAKVVEYDSTNLTLVMTEEARVAAVRTSTFAPNGDGDIPLLDLQEGALLDVGQNRHVEKTGIPIIEIPDTIAPKILSARLNYSFGELKLTFQETLDLTPATRFNVSNIRFGNTSTVEANFALDDLEGGGARLIDDEGDAISVTFLFSEEQRTTLLEFSGVPGGDEFAAFITFGSSSFVDLFLNPNVAGFQNLIEHPDVVPPEYSRSLYF